MNQSRPDAVLRPMPAKIGDIRMIDGLSFKQAFATLIIALAVGLAGSAYELWNDYRTMHEQVRLDMQAETTLVRGLAVEAAYQLSEELAGEVVGGLFQNSAVVEVGLIDNFGGVLGRRDRDRTATPFPGVAERLFGDVETYSVALETKNPNGTATTVGKLHVQLDSGALMNVWLQRAAAAALSGAVRAVLVCALVVAVFYVLITKPLLRITESIGRVDPDQPGAAPIAMPRGHAGDELGLLVSTINSLLTQSQQGLDDRDAAQDELAALARELESRVVQRTQELAKEKEGVERALAQLNVANTELEKANRDINDGIRYAGRIQTALLPDQGALDGLVQEFAVGWQPLDMVGGDYYWAGIFGRRGVLAVMDCTGHGVPGAFMTAVASSAFSRILHHHGHEDPAAMLNQLNKLVKTALRQDREGAVSNDGLDAAICVVDSESRTVAFAGANLPLLVVENGVMEQIKGDRMSLGYVDSPEDYRFSAHTVPYGPGTSFYLYTDGVTDQVGGPNHRLFGRRRLQNVLMEAADRPISEQMDHLYQSLSAWRGEEKRRDDMTFMAFRPVSQNS